MSFKLGLDNHDRWIDRQKVDDQIGLYVDRSRSTMINRNKKMVIMNEIFLHIRIAICLIKLIKRSIGSIFFVFVSAGI